MNSIIKSLLNGIASFLLVALAQTLIKGVTFVQALVSPYTVFLAVTAIVFSFIGFTVKATRQ